MRKLTAHLLAKAGARLPVTFRVLHAQFLLRVIDLEALSLDADVPRFLGQFAGVLLMFSFIHSFAVYVQVIEYPWRLEHYLISTTMLVVGLVTVVSWDSIFPDRRDIMVLAPLPIRPGMILSAKVAASASLLAIALLALNAAPSFVASVLLGGLHQSFLGFFQVMASYWIAMLAAASFLYCCVLSFQGLTALLLPRRAFLRLSAALQLIAFGLFISVYFLEPALGTLPELLAPQSHHVLAMSPQFWFLALCNQVNGTLPTKLQWLANRAWLALALSVLGATTSLALAYLRTMKATLGAPDLMPGASGPRWTPRVGSGLRVGIMAFCFRSLSRSRQHRVVFAFFMAIIAAIGVTCLRREIYSTAPEPIPTGFLISTVTMMGLAVAAMRAVFSLPISLNANWMLRITQLRPASKYVAATRLTLWLFSVLPMLLTVALLSLNYRSWQRVAGHLVILALFGLIFAELALIRFDKVPFTCSYMPGKANVQFVFWGSMLIWLLLLVVTRTIEQSALQHRRTFLEMAGSLILVLVALGAVNRWRARSAVLYFEDAEPELMTSLNLLFVPSAQALFPSSSK